MRTGGFFDVLWSNFKSVYGPILTLASFLVPLPISFLVWYLQPTAAVFSCAGSGSGLLAASSGPAAFLLTPKLYAATAMLTSAMIDTTISAILSVRTLLVSPIPSSPPTTQQRRSTQRDG